MVAHRGRYQNRRRLEVQMPSVEAQLIAQRDAALRVVEAARYWAHKPDMENLTTWKSARDRHLSRALRAWESGQGKETQ